MTSSDLAAELIEARALLVQALEVLEHTNRGSSAPYGHQHALALRNLRSYLASITHRGNEKKYR